MPKLITEEYHILLFLWENRLEDMRGFLNAHYNYLVRLNQSGFLTVIYGKGDIPKEIIFSCKALAFFRRHYRQRYEYQQMLDEEHYEYCI